ncbi:MAG: NAD(P)-dependent oxidoreductase [Bacteroidota bacterium]
MKICFIDTIKASHVDMSSNPLSESGHEIYFDKKVKADCDVIVGGMPSEVQIRSPDDLKALIIPFSGLIPQTRKVLLTHCPELPVYNVKHNSTAVAEMALTLLLSCKRSLLEVDCQLREGDWSYRFSSTKDTLIHGSKATIIGYGAIGKKVANLLIAMGVTVNVVRNTSHSVYEENGVIIYPPKELVSALDMSDALIICCALTDQTVDLIRYQHFEVMSPLSYLVNVSRSEIVNEKDLYDALKKGILRGAGIDVWPNFPTSPERITSTAPSALDFDKLHNVIMSPHRAGQFHSNYKMRLIEVLKIVQELSQEKQPKNQVDIFKGY